ncbi:hypothetical protein [Psychrobacter sp. Ps7]|uniref:hypothetical protein n=1 Tax=Psychrobacter sp. Ps7 TaxID=2790961 RepID=UPI001EDF2BF9|nr:hypothetical protein [Psychrobacter sp. Ps7]MCG3873085.1 hypothetical protein [Psychrobacter sp. Ps7]
MFSKAKTNFDILLLQMLLLLASSLSNASDINFQKYSIPNLGEISIPLSMELQGGRYKELNNEVLEIINARADLGLSKDGRYVFQQKGLNSFDKNGFNTYARIIIHTTLGNYSEYASLKDPYALTAFERNQLSKQLRTQTTQSLAKINIKIIRWYGINPVKINDQNALEISYLRQLGNNPYVAVRAYYFENNDREHLVTVSYRLSDEKVWKPLFIKSLKSLKIINR